MEVGLYYYFSGRDALVGFLLEQHLSAAGETLEDATPRPSHQPSGSARRSRRWRPTSASDRA